MKNSKNSKNIFENNDDESNDNSFLKLFCYDCLRYPEYSPKMKFSLDILA